MLDALEVSLAEDPPLLALPLAEPECVALPLPLPEAPELVGKDAVADQNRCQRKSRLRTSHYRTHWHWTQQWKRQMHRSRQRLRRKFRG